MLAGSCCAGQLINMGLCNRLSIVLENKDDLQGFPSDQAAQLFAILFHAGIASILGLYTIFWLGLDLLHTLPILAVLGILTAASGYQALYRQANARLKAQ